jgi:hypothetical protein
MSEEPSLYAGLATAVRRGNLAATASTAAWNGPRVVQVTSSDMGPTGAFRGGTQYASATKNARPAL